MRGVRHERRAEHSTLNISTLLGANISAVGLVGST
jgi:hypothetical protein